MQDRWVSYIYRYKDGKRWENAGYIKVIRTSRGNVDEARVDIGLKLYKPLMCRCKVYMIYDGRELFLLDELLVRPEERDAISFKKTFTWKDFLKTGLTPKDYDGVFFAVDDGDSLMSLWNDKEINISDLSVGDGSSKVGLIPMPDYLKMAGDGEKYEESNREESSVAEEYIDNSKATKPARASANFVEQPEQVRASENSVEQPEQVRASANSVEQPEQVRASVNPEEQQVQVKYSTNLVEQLMETSIKIPIFIDSPFSECVKIVPQDIGRLPMGNWKLGQNSFLTHSYYRYKYIMLGKIKFDKREIYVIGVPGVFTNKEKYLANMFGFNLFMPVKKADTKTGSFGYWVWEVLKE